ncbi:hypothetical protein BJ508DRAFT_203689 [Ascobolus immersus RN42]|uniref:AA9 family lytic polysaccharide monooxygenase n=1 Tax=Ascobolus immersus RN42 TaxID=1160509 RepID=A0A3N4IKX9_ASCIM|nr:hypothetical protein BJ508DRAFT_203689 [Ascobolus immersus RN42]
MATSTQSCVRQVPNNFPIEDVTSPNMSCNVNGNVPASSVCSVQAGSTVKVEWHHVSRQQTGGDDPIADSHKGPIISYLAKVDNAATATNTQSLSWFKIQEEGLNGGVWAVDRLNAKGTGEWDVKIPSNIPAGDYLLRNEIIALHSAGSYPGAQFYMGCVQIRVAGGSGGNPSPTVRFPGAYSGSDPGVRVNIWSGLSSYVIPGPPVFGSSGGSNPQPTTSQAPQPTTSQAPQPTSTTSQAPQPTGGAGGAAQWAQCGGIGHTGPTTCATGTCVKLNDYYSQCQ